MFERFAEAFFSVWVLIPKNNSIFSIFEYTIWILKNYSEIYFQKHT